MLIARNELDGDPADIATRISQMSPWPDSLPLSAPVQDRLQRRLEIEAHVAELVSLKEWMAHEFGRVRGWRWSRSSDFDEACLAAGKTNAGSRMRYYGREWPREFTKHRYHYRHPDRRAAAVVGHPYDVTADIRKDAERWAAANGLRVSFPTDFPSWWCPGRTTLVLFEPASTHG